MSEKQQVIAIDGPSGVGKSTISRRVAAACNFTYLDTGAMYRAVALKLDRDAIDLDDEVAVRQGLATIDLQLIPASEADGDVGVILDGCDVSRDIRTNEASMLASRVSAIPAVREKLTQMQQRIGEQGRVVAEGRDTGTVVFPRAFCKFYLDADPEERARRRALQLKNQGREVDEAQLLALIIKRDRDDQQRTIAPLTKAEDAVVVDTTSITIDQVCEKMLAIIRSRLD